jgi:hypothetical protein
MENQTPSIRALLLCGAVAGPLYVAITLVQALTRDGFDIQQHRFTYLTTGDLGWIHQANMVLVGVLTVLLAVGMRQVLRAGRGAVWAPRLLGLFGVAYVVGGLLRADPVVGLPPGTTPEMLHQTWHGVVQNASRGVSTLLLLATSLVIARRFAAEGRRAWAWLCGFSIPLVFAALAALGFAIGTNPGAVAFLAMPWVWVTALAVYLYRREASRRSDVAAGPWTRSAPVAG